MTDRPADAHIPPVDEHGVGSGVSAGAPQDIVAGDTADPPAGTSTVDLVCASCRISLVLGSAEASTTALSPITVHWQDAPAWHQEPLAEAIERLLTDHTGHFLQVLARRWHQYARYFLDDLFIVGPGDTSDEPGYVTYGDYIRGWCDPVGRAVDHHSDPGQPSIQDPRRRAPMPMPRHWWARFERVWSSTAARTTRSGSAPRLPGSEAAPSGSWRLRGRTPQLGSPLLDQHDPAADTVLLICVPCRLEVELGRAICHTTGITGPVTLGTTPVSQDPAGMMAVWRLLTDHTGHDLITLPLAGTAYAWFRESSNEPAVRVGTHHVRADADLTHAAYGDGWPERPTHPSVQGATPVVPRCTAGCPDAATADTTGDPARPAGVHTAATHATDGRP